MADHDISAAVGERGGAPDETMTIQGDESRLDALIFNSPFSFYRGLREQRPVFYDSKLDVYLVSRYDDVAAILRDDDAFSLERGYQDRWSNGFLDELSEIVERDGGGFIRDPAYDPPLHTRYRRLIDKAFTAQRVKSLEPRIRETVIEIIESLLDQGHADARMDIGVPMTARIMCEQLGFDYAEVGPHRISRWAGAIVAQMGRMQSREEMLENAREICDLQNYIIRKIEERQEHPSEDMTSDLVHAYLPDQEHPRLTRREQIAWVRALLVGGADSTTSALTNLMLVLATQPGLAQQLYEVADDDRLLTRFVEEALRIHPPVHGLYRTATRNVEIGGTLIPADGQVCILFASANSDENRFPFPRELNVERNNMGGTLTFGAGIHRCVAAALARMEVKVAAREIIKRMDNIQLAMDPHDITYLPTLGIQTIAQLPITFSRRKS